MVVGAGSKPAASFANVDSALNGGVEFEFRKALDFLAPKPNVKARKTLRDLSIGANFAYVDVELPEGWQLHTCEERPDRDAILASWRAWQGASFEGDQELSSLTFEARAVVELDAEGVCVRELRTAADITMFGRSGALEGFYAGTRKVNCQWAPVPPPNRP